VKLTRRDGLFALVIAAIIGVLVVTGRKEKAKMIPRDKNHLFFYERMDKGAVRTDMESMCRTCHNVNAVTLPLNHPPKEQCLLCHRLRQ
jgi:hypothetical protein